MTSDRAFHELESSDKYDADREISATEKANMLIELSRRQEAAFSFCLNYERKHVTKSGTILSRSKM